MRRAVLSAIVLVVALLLQLTVVNRIALPGGGGSPDLVLLAVVALGMFTSAAGGAVTGFCAGLALDLAPPGSYLIGEYALVFCVIGYACGRVRGALRGSAVLTAGAAIAAAAAGEALSAALGRVTSDPQVSWAAIRDVLPSSVVYDAVLTPFVLYGVMRAVRWADGLLRAPSDGGVLLARARPAVTARPGATVLGGAGLLGGAGWVSGPGGARGLAGSRAARRAGRGHVPRSPRLRQAAVRPGDGWIGGGHTTGLRHVPPRPARKGQAPRLRPRAGHPGSAAARSARLRSRSQPDLRLGARRRRDGTVGRSLGSGAAGPAFRGGARPGPPGSAFRGPGPGAARRAGRPRVPARGRGFRPDPRLRGGSASGGLVSRGRSARPVTLRFGGGRRRGGVVGGGVLGGGVLGGGSLGGGSLGGRPPGRALGGGRLRGRALRGSGLRTRTPAPRTASLRGKALRGSGLRTRTPKPRSASLRGKALRGGPGSLAGPRRRGARAVPLRLGSPRRRDGMLGGLALRPRLRAGRQAAPRFRSGPSLGRRLLLLTGIGRLAQRRQAGRARFSPGSRSLVAAVSGGRLGGRSTVWRIGSRRTGGM
jgi:rod shape-determining protein MreD